MRRQPYINTLEMIGRTPMLAVHRLDTGPCRLFLKLENQNPGGSIKDRIGLYLIEAAERDGKIKPGGLLIEATAGNTGLGLALVAAQKGYRLQLVIPDKMSQEKIFHLKAMGAEVVMTRSDVGKGHPEYYQDLAARLARETPGSYYVNQFGNEANIRAHEETTAPEIWAQLDHKLDAVVCGVGTGGTITGLSRYFARTAPDVEIVLADPATSALAGYVRTGKVEPSGRGWLVEGIGGDYVPAICDLSHVKQAYSIPDVEAFQTCRELLAQEGIIAGTSTGTLLAAALRYCREQKTPKRVVTFVCDSGNKYLSKVYNDYWMIDNGFVERETVRRPARSGPATAPGARYRNCEFNRDGGCRAPAHEALRHVAAARDAGGQDRRAGGRRRHPARSVQKSQPLRGTGDQGDEQPPGHHPGGRTALQPDGNLQEGNGRHRDERR